MTEQISTEIIHNNLPDFNINLIFESEQRCDISTPLHNHSEIEMILVEKGAVNYIVGCGEEVIVREGEVLFVNSMTAHETKTADMSTKVYILQFNLFGISPDRLLDSNKYLWAFINSNNVAWHKFQSEDSGRIRGCIKSIYSEMTTKGKGFEPMIVSDIYCILAELMRCDIINTLHTQADKAADSIQTMLDYIDKNYMNDIDLRRACEMLHISRAQFCRNFKKATGDTFVHYLNFKRVCEAERLLCITDDGVTKIAFEVGFSDTSYFCKIFKHYYSVSPQKYRIMKREKH